MAYEMDDNSPVVIMIVVTIASTATTITNHFILPSALARRRKLTLPIPSSIPFLKPTRANFYLANITPTGVVFFAPDAGTYPS
jgi:hypothetical protein